MQPRALTAADLGKEVSVTTEKVTITGRLDSYKHRTEDLAQVWGGMGPGKLTVVTTITVAGHVLEDLLDGAEVTVHG